MHMVKTVYAVYGTDFEAPGLIIIFHTKARAVQVKDELNAWSLENPGNVIASPSCLGASESAWNEYLARQQSWQAKSPIHHLDPESTAWLYKEFVVIPLTVYDEAVVPGLMRVRAARRIAKKWRLWQRFERIAALAHKLGIVPEEVEKESKNG